MSNDCIPSQDQMRYRASIACLQGGCNIHVPERGEEFDRFIAKVYADGMRSVADWIDGGTPRAYGFEHPCDPPGVRTEPGKKERELMGIADATREAASRIEEKADRIERGER